MTGSASRSEFARRTGRALRRGGIGGDSRTRQNGDDRNYHAHILFTTREMTPEGLGKKTRVLDDRKTGPQEVAKLRELAADIINKSLAAANSDIRVDHRSFKERGIEREPTTHLGPAASEMERRGEQTERGDINREAAPDGNASCWPNATALDTAIENEQERISSPPADPEDALRAPCAKPREPFREAIATKGAVPDIRDGRPDLVAAAWHASGRKSP